MTPLQLRFRSAYLICCLFVLNFSCHLNAQSIADTVEIATVEVQAIKVRGLNNVGGTVQNWSAEDLKQLPAQNIAELLSTQGGAYIKSYGLGSLATSSIRGGTAGHTLVLWNGVPIQSPMLGQLDLALLPTFGQESIHLVKGGQAALWGSGAIGGILHLNNQASFTHQLAIENRTLFGSFGQFQQQAKIAFGREKWQSVTKVAYQEADNDFEYLPAPGLARRRQTNAALNQSNLQQDFYWKPNEKYKLGIHFWRQESDRQIPPTLVQNRSEAHQDDLSNRILLDLQRIGNQAQWQFKAAFFEEELNFFDDLILLESRSRFRTLLGELSTRISLGNQNLINIGTTHNFSEAWSAGYRERVPEEYRAALFASWLFRTSTFQSELSIRQEVVDGQSVPLVPSLGLQYMLTNKLTVAGKVSRNYRLPTLNDRFWIPGGNPDLLAESGWSQELSLHHEMGDEGQKLLLSITGFNRNIDNWILWSVREGQSFFSANNIAKVWSRGLESRINWTYQAKDWQINLKAGYDYLRSTNQIAIESPSIDKGEQLWYTPEHQGFGQLFISWKNLQMNYQHNFFGPTQGINSPIESYQVGNLRLQYQHSWKSLTGSYFFTIQNLWDSNYVVIERRPMPGIHFQTGIQINFNQTK